MVGSGDSAHHSRPVGSLFARHGFCSAVVGSTTLSCPTGCLVHQSLAHFFRYACFCSSAPLALRLFFGVVHRCRHRANSTCSFQSLCGYARFCCLIDLHHLKFWIKSTSALLILTC